MNYETLRYEIADHILTLTLNRPERMNAFTARMADELMDAFDAADADDEIKFALTLNSVGYRFESCTAHHFSRLIFASYVSQSVARIC